MNRGNLLPASLLSGFMSALAGSLLKIMHWPAASWLLVVGLLLLLVFVVAALYEIATFRQVPGGQRVLWMMVLLVGGPLGWLLYLAVGRVRFTARQAP